MEDVVMKGCTCVCEVTEEVGKSGVTLMQFIEIGLILFITVLVIIGLIVGFQKLKVEDE